VVDVMARSELGWVVVGVVGLSSAATHNTKTHSYQNCQHMHWNILVCSTKKIMITYVRSEVFTVATMKNGVFWDVTTCGSSKNWRFGGT
jgi:hypothetical protein